MRNSAATGAEWLAHTLAAAGTTHVFFVDAILRRTLIELGAVGVTRVLAHTEKGAAYMADGYARISGRPGMCWAQSVGAANLAAGLQDAWLAHSPVIAMTGRKTLSQQRRNAYQEIDHAPLFAPVTKFSAMVESTADLPRLFRQAWRTATAWTAGPVHLDLNSLLGEAAETGLVAEEPGAEPFMKKALPAHRPLPSDEELAVAKDALLSADKIAIVVGTGAAVSRAGAELIALAECLQAPVGASLGAIGLVPSRHPLFIGGVGSYSAPPANRIVSEADLVVFVGCHTGDQVTHGWTVPAPNTRIVQIDADPVELGRNYRNTVGVMGDPKATLAALVEALSGVKRGSEFAHRARRLVEDWRGSIEPLQTSSERPTTVERLCAEITRALPENGILVADTGYSGIWSNTLLEFDGKTQTYLRAAGSLGWAFPASLGAKCAAPERPVICFCGDGGFYYHLAELETARRRGINVVAVINNNSGLGQGWPGVRAMQNTKDGDPGHLSLLERIDFAAVAESFGVKGIRVTEPRELRSALAASVGATEPVVIDVVTDIEARAPEAWSPEILC